MLEITNQLENILASKENIYHRLSISHKPRIWFAFLTSTQISYVYLHSVRLM